MSILKIKNLTKYYGNGKHVVKALDDVSFSMDAGEFTAIMGASGSGKSTLLNVISSIDAASAGEIAVEGVCLSQMGEKALAAFRRDRLGFIFQEYNLIDTLTVEENIVLPLHLKRMSPGKTSRRLSDIAGKLEITDQLKKFPRDLSGGQRQRVACARALITNPALVLADEPTGALDSGNSRRLMETFRRMNAQFQSTILMVTHDAMMGAYASRVLFLKDGRIWNELYRGDRSRRALYHEILDVMAVLGGDGDVR